MNFSRHLSRHARLCGALSLCALALIAPAHAQDSRGGSGGSSGGGNDARGGSSGGGGAGGGANDKPATPPIPLRESNSVPSGRNIVGELTAGGPRRPIPARKNLTAKQRAIEARRIAKMTPAQRKQMIFDRYTIPPTGWLASYLPADRYKFGKVWQYVSTETDRRYYRPQDMARKRFNANRVIGFRSWQEAMLAGYSPDPVTKPAPGAQIAAVARYTRGPNFYRFVEFVYSGQVSPAQFEATYNYARQVTASLNRYSYSRPYLNNTLDRIFQATVEGDPSIIPRTIGGPPPAPRQAAANGGGGDQSAPNFPSAGNVQSPDARGGVGSGAGTGGSEDKRASEFNKFGNRAGSMANVPANR